MKLPKQMILRIQAQVMARIHLLKQRQKLLKEAKSIQRLRTQLRIVSKLPLLLRPKKHQQKRLKAQMILPKRTIAQNQILTKRPITIKPLPK